jgi:putative endonuclease
MPSSETPGKSPNRVRTGRIFEQQALQFYLDQGFTLLGQNWQASHKEIDLIVRKDDLIAFVEVKAARSNKFGHPVEKLSRKKITNLTEAARRFLDEMKISGCDIRFDVVTFFQGKMEHYPAAFTADE